MKAVRVHAFGGPEVLTYEDAPDPAAPGAGLAAVDIQIIGINYSDTNYRRGLGVARTMSLPLIPGHEAAGVVTAIGEGVTEVKVGDRVVFAGQCAGSLGNDIEGGCDPMRAACERLGALSTDEAAADDPDHHCRVASVKSTPSTSGSCTMREAVSSTAVQSDSSSTTWANSSN